MTAPPLPLREGEAPTPRTDAIATMFHGSDLAVSVEITPRQASDQYNKMLALARELERELATLRAKNAELHTSVMSLGQQSTARTLEMADLREELRRERAKR